MVRYGYDVYTDNGNEHWKAPEGWQAERLRDSDGNLVFKKMVDEQLMISQPYSKGKKREFFEAELHYARNFGMHQVGAILKYSQDGTTDNSENNWVHQSDDDPIKSLNIAFQRTIQGIDRRHQGLAGRFTYGYANRYSSTSISATTARRTSQKANASVSSRLIRLHGTSVRSLG